MLNKLFYFFSLVTILLIFFFTNNSFATEGIEYIFSIPPVFEESLYNNYITLYVISSEETEVTVEVPAEYFNKKKTKPSQALVFEIDASFGQVSSWNIDDRTAPPPPSNIYINRAIRVSAEKPILCYVICRYYCTSDGFIAFPVSHLGKEYTISSFPDMGGFYGDFYYPSETTITATSDDTNVKFILGGSTATKINFNDSTYSTGDTLVAKLDKGDVWLLMSDGERKVYPDLSGSRVESNKPVSVNSGNVCANVPINKPSCDYITTMEFPTKTWGKEYLVPPITRRKKSHLARIYAKEDSTIIYYNMQPIDTIFFNKNNSMTNNSTNFSGFNWIEMRLGSSNPEPAVISSNKPIYVNFFYSSWTEDSVSLTDPFTTPILPIEMYSRSVSFSIPKSTSSNPFDSNYINIVCARQFDTNIFKDFYVLYYDEHSNLFEYTAADFDLISWADFPSKINNKTYSYFTLKLPKTGLYTINSKVDFACYLYGFANVTAYGFPVFPVYAFSKNIDKEAPQVLANISCDGSVINGIIKDLPDYGYRSNLNSIVLLKDESYNINFNFNPFAVGASQETNWNLSVKDIKFDAKAAIKVADVAGNIDTFRLQYYGLDGMYLKPVRNEVCIDSLGSDTLVYELCNPKNADMQIKLFIKQNHDILTLVSPDSVLIKANSSTVIKFKIKFDNYNENKFLVLQKCYESDTIWLPIEYKITNYAINITPVSFNHKYIIGDTVKFKLKLNSKYSKAEELKKITEMQLKIKYKNIFAYLDTMNLNLFSMPNWKISEKLFYIDSDSNTIFIAKLNNSSGLTLSENTSIEANFKLMLPINTSSNFQIAPEDYKIKIYTNIESNYSPCATFYSNPAEVFINPICADNLRLIKTSNNDFSINISNSVIKYSIGFDCKATISIYDAIGVNIKTIFSDDCKAGSYELLLNEKDFTKGVYFCELTVSGLLRKIVGFIVL